MLQKKEERNTDGQREELERLLDRLKKNVEMVGVEELKTRYAAAYGELLAEIGRKTGEYVKSRILDGVTLRREFLKEYLPFIEEEIAVSGLKRAVSEAAFRHRSIDGIDGLCLSMRERIEKRLERECRSHMGLLVYGACLKDPENHVPLLYNEVTGCVKIGNAWIPEKVWRMEGPENPVVSAGKKG